MTISKQFCYVPLFCMITLAFSGCISSVSDVTGVFTKPSSSSNSDDQTRTKAEGTATGAVLGGIAGSLVGKGGATNTMVGALVGSGVGFVLGSEVAKRKQTYKNAEDLIDGESQRTAQTIQEVKAVNNSLRADISHYRKQIDKLNKQVKQDASKKEALQQQKAIVDKRYTETKQALEGVQNELSTTQALYDESAASSASKAKLKNWEARISKLKQEKVQLEQHTGQLQTISSQIAL